MTRPIAFVYDAGGLCNRIFPFAHLLAVSQLTNRQLFNPTFRRYAGYFMGTNPDFQDGLRPFWKSGLPPSLRLPAWTIRFKIARRAYSSTTVVRPDDEFVDLQAMRETGQLDGVRWLSALYSVDNDAFRKFENLIRIYFRPVPPIESRVRGHLEIARQDVDVLVGVHVRHGDYVTHAGGMMYYNITEYRELMDRIADQLPGKRVGFLVCSNVSQDSGAFTGLRWHRGPGSEIEDLISLAGCDYLVGPPSTYTQWASFYGRVPRYVHNRKYEEKFGVAPVPLLIDEFRVHSVGFGKFKFQIES